MPMSEPWLELVQTIQDVHAPANLRQEIVRRRALLQGDAAGQPMSKRDEPERRSAVLRRVPRAAAVLGVIGAVAAVVVVLVIAAHTRRDTPSVSASQVTVVRPQRVKVTARIVGGSPGLRRAVRASLAGVGKTAITKVTITPAGHKYGHAPKNGVALTYTSRQGEGTLSDYTAWQEGLVGTAARDRAIVQGLAPVVFNNTESMGSHVLATHVPLRNSPSVQQAIAQARQAAKRLGVKVKHITVLHPYGLAVYLIVSIPDPGPYLYHHGALEAAFPDQLSVDGPTQLDGWYVAAQSAGTTIAEANADNRSNTTSSWVLPQYRGCTHQNTILMGNPAIHAPPPPPCPGVQKAIHMPRIIGDTRVQAEAALRELGIRSEPVILGMSRRQALHHTVTGQWPQPGSIFGPGIVAQLIFGRPQNHG
jgi:hypothetical protein